MRLRLLGSILPVLAGCCALPAVLIALVGRRMIMPPMWVHFYGVGVTALVATAAAVALTTIGARQGDVRTVVIGGGFSLMAALLAVHGLATPGVILGTNGLIAISGGVTLPVGGAVLAFCALPRFATATAIPRVVALQTALAAGIVALAVVGALRPALVPSVPAPKSPEALTLLAVGLCCYGALGLRAAHTFLLTRRGADLAVVFGVAL